MPDIPQDKLAALAATGATNREIVATLGRAMTAPERAVVDRARLKLKLRKASSKRPVATTPTDEPTPDTISEIMKQDVANVIAKSRAGKPLTNSERSLLREVMPETPEKEDSYENTPKTIKVDARMKDAVMAHIGCVEQVAYRWLRKLQGMKTSRGWPARDVLATIDARRREAGGSVNSDLKRQKLEEETLILRARRMKEWNELISIEDHNAEIDFITNAFVSSLENWVQRIAAEKRDASILIWAEETRDAVIAQAREACK